MSNREIEKNEALARIEQLEAALRAVRNFPYIGGHAAGEIAIIDAVLDQSSPPKAQHMSTPVQPSQPRTAPLAEWEDQRVQLVYGMLCGHEMPPNPEEHWEGYLARRIIAELDLAMPGVARSSGITK